MNTFGRSLVLALSMLVVSTIGIACGSSSTPNNDAAATGGSSGSAGGSTGAGGATSSTGGSTGAGGHADAGAAGGSTGAGGASGTDAGSGGCAQLLACCNTPGAPAQAMTLCLQQYNNSNGNNAACANILQMIKNNGLCN